MYTAVVLTETSRARIKHTFSSHFSLLEQLGFQMKNAQGDDLLHHVTVNLGNFDMTLNDPELIGKEITFKLISLGEDEKVVALGVECEVFKERAIFGNPKVLSFNTKPHVTAMINPSKGGKPVMSNGIAVWNTITPITVQGVLQVEP